MDKGGKEVDTGAGTEDAGAINLLHKLGWGGGGGRQTVLLTQWALFTRRPYISERLKIFVLPPETSQ